MSGDKKGMKISFSYESETGVECLKAEAESTDRFLEKIRDTILEILESPAVQNLGVKKPPVMGIVTPMTSGKSEVEKDGEKPEWFRSAVKRRLDRLDGPAKIDLLLSEFVAIVDDGQDCDLLETGAAFIKGYGISFEDPEWKGFVVAFAKATKEQRIIMAKRWLEPTGASEEFTEKALRMVESLPPELNLFWTF